MANVKEIHIEAVVPFNWLDTGDKPFGNGALEADVARIGSLLLTPTIGLRHTFARAGVRPVPETGGEMALYCLTIDGAEAISYPGLDSLRATLERLGASILVWRVRDLEA